jgi:hypothetical protein
VRKGALLLSIVAALCGCADTPVRYAPTRLPADLSSARLPKLLLEDVVDQTGGGEIVDAGVPWTGNRTAVDWTEAVHDALVLELQRLSWPTTESRSSAGARLHAAMVHARVDTDFAGHKHGKAKIVIDVVLKNPDGRQVWEAELNGAGQGGVLDQGAAWNMALNDAMTRLGPMLAEERPWERLDSRAGEPNAGVAHAATSDQSVSSDIDELPPAGPTRPGTYAVVIGVEHYRSRLPNADFAVNDARLTAEYFKRVLGVPESNVALLTDAQATKGDFEKYFERWLPNHVGTGDTVYVYYSGHGAPDPAKGGSYLVPYDGDPTYIESTGFEVKRLLGDLSRLPAKRVYLALDSCFSGAGGRSVIASGARPLVNVLPAEVPANVTVLSASAGDQISNSYRVKGHGLFTYFLLRGLTKKQGDLLAAFDYLKPEVSRVAKSEYNSAQEPQWRQGK